MKNDLIIREPELYFDSIHNELNNFLRDTFFAHTMANPLNVKKVSTWRPAIEVSQSDKCYKVKVQLPGVKKDDIEIELDNDFLTLTADRGNSGGKGRKIRRRKKSALSYKRIPLW